MVAVIGFVVCGALYDALRQGSLLETEASRQEEAQAAAARALREILDGTPDRALPGLRQVRKVECGPDGLAYRAGAFDVSCYLGDGQLFWVAVPSEDPLEVRRDGGEVLAKGITAFTAAQDPATGLVTLTVVAGDPVSGGEGARFTTAVRPRNRRP